MSKAFSACPHCGSSEGFYTLTDYINVQEQFNFQGVPLYSGSPVFYTKGYRDYEKAIEKKMGYCIDCDMEVAPVETLIRQRKDTDLGAEK